MINGHLRSETFLCEATEGRLEREERAELVNAYFEFFSVDRERVANHIRETLAQDMLLLRFFCVVYGSFDKPKGYIQPNVNHFYREELFESYLKGKLQTAEVFLQSVTTTISPVSENQKFIRVLEICAEQMVSKWEFGNVPMNVIPAELHDALYSLLDEELIIRQDASAPESEATSSEAINFTFDEFRDFMLSQYLVRRVFAGSQAEFIRLISKADPEREQPTEGLKRFLFYAARKKKNVAFGKFYRSQPWYSDVYHREVFNLDSRNLDAQDSDAVRKRLESGPPNDEAMQIARALAYRWNRNRWPVLNLGLLLDHVEKAGPTAYQDLISKAIGGHDFRRSNSVATAFFSFVSEQMHDLKARFSIYEDVVRLLIMLLPIESTYTLSSPAYDVLVRVVEQQPEQTTTMLAWFSPPPIRGASAVRLAASLRGNAQSPGRPHPSGGGRRLEQRTIPAELARDQADQGSISISRRRAMIKPVVDLSNSTDFIISVPEVILGKQISNPGSRPPQLVRLATRKQRIQRHICKITRYQARL